MKKFMVMLLMMVMAAFASPLFALDESPPGVKTFNSINAGEMIYGKNGLGLVGAAHADDITFGKVYIHHKDSLMYSSDRGQLDNTARWKRGSNQNANMNLAYATVAVVCYPRGGIEV